MNDSTLGAVALGVGALGLLLVVVAGVAAVSANARARQSRAAPAAPEPQTQATSTSEVPASGRSWVWLKAGVFAFIHAGAVSFVLGGLTFFEDIARAHEEIRTTGTVTFPKRLLPKTLAVPDASQPLARVGEELLRNGGQQARARSQVHADSAEPIPSGPGATDWEVVDVVPEQALE